MILQIDLPDYDKIRKDAMLDPDEQVREMKKKGEQPYRQSIDRPMVVASTSKWSLLGWELLQGSLSMRYLPYLLKYKSHSCISRTPTLELKIGTKLF